MDRAIRELLKSLPDVAVAACDTADNIVVFSPGFRQIVGDLDPRAVADYFRAVPLFDREGGRELTAEERPLMRALRGESVRDLIAASPHVDGTWRHLRFNSAPVRGRDDRIRGAISIVQDVSSEVRQHQHQAELRDNLITTINHHFRTPISLILGHAELLEDYREDLPLEAQRSVDALARGAKRLHELARAVSELVELAAAHELDLSHGDVSSHLRRQLARQEQLARDAQVSLRLDGPAELRLHGDLTLIERAVGALLRNAIQHAPPGTKVTVELVERDGLATIAVTDEGPGISVGERTRLLQLFETGRTEPHTHGGRGLGLALAHTVALAHGGRLDLSANRPAGLRVEMTLQTTRV